MALPTPLLKNADPRPMMNVFPTVTTTMRLPPIRSTAVLALMLPLGFAWASGSWDTVVRDGGRQVQIDRNSIIQSDRGTKVAWGRIVLAPSEAAGRPYKTVQALNRYDCRDRSFYTVKRRYLDARNLIVDEEDVAEPQPIAVEPDTVDERLWREVCRPPTVQDLARLAGEAERVAGLATAARDAANPAVPMPAVLPAASAHPTGAAPSRAAGAAEASPPPGSLRPTSAPVAARAPAPARAPAFPDAFAPPRASAAPAAAASPGAPDNAPAVPASSTPSPSARASSAAAAGAGKSRVALASPAPSRSAMSDAAVRARAAATRARETEWSYSGATGPEHWGRLRPDWAVCEQGTRQSPIDLRNGVTVDLEPVQFDYRPTRFRITDTGRTLKVQVGAGMGVDIRGRRYELEHFQLHRPSEERVGGRAYDMNIHFHHRDEEGRIAIVAVLLEGGAAPHPLVQTLWSSLPLERGDHYLPPMPIDLASLVPASPAHFLYMGSLTTPPCTEGVLWVVMKEPVRVSDEQLDVFARLYPRNGRPIQPPHGRLILESR
ncbi:MAG TPA: carbonic anhydrase family protein [Rhodocyclaceae bacterium]|nr:carbonic anhydrase family protein [Rhodocyclaceae bacterium]